MRAPVDYRLGILFVHGIGQQRRGETLVNCGESLQEWLRRWLTEDKGEDTIVAWQDARLRPSAEDPAAPPHACGTWNLPDGTINVLMAECWWADCFESPSFGELLVWIREAALVTLSIHFSTRLRRQWKRMAGPGSSKIRRVWESLKVGREIVYFLIGWPLLAIVLLVFMVLIFVVNLIPGTGRLVKRIQALMAATVGDSYAFLKRPIQRGAVTGQLHRDLRWVATRCDRLAIVAHSQGAAVTHVALRQGLPANLDERNCLFITLGSGLRKLEELAKIRDERESLGYATLGGLLLMLAGAWLRGWLPFPAPSQEWINPWWPMGIGAFLWLGDVVRTLEGIELPEGRFEPLRRFGKAIPWLDFYAIADPVPNGSLLNSKPAFIRSQDVHNRNSNFVDHTRYWENMEQFTGPVACAVARLVGAELSSEADRQWMSVAWQRRFLRVTALAWTRALVTVSTLTLIALLWLQGRLTPFGELAVRKMTDVLDSPGWRFVADKIEGLTDWLHPALIAVAAIAAAVTVIFQSLKIVWASWERQEIARFFKRRPYERFDVTAGIFLGAVFMLVASMAAVALRLLPLPGEVAQWNVARVVVYALSAGMLSGTPLLFWGWWNKNYGMGWGLGLASFGFAVPLMLVLIRSPFVDPNVDPVSGWTFIFFVAIILVSSAATYAMTAPFRAQGHESERLVFMRDSQNRTRS